MSNILFLKNIIPVPFKLNSTFSDGYNVEQSDYCRKCSSRECCDFATRPFSHYLCSSGFSCYPIKINDTSLVLFGLIDSSLNSAINGFRRRSYESYYFSLHEAERLQQRLKLLYDSMGNAVLPSVHGNISFLHDIRTSVGLVLSWCQNIIDRTPGISFEEKLDLVGQDMLNIFQSINLLLEQLNLAGIMANPDYITHGRKSPSQLHGFLFRMVRIFQHRAISKNVKIVLRGSTRCSIKVYNSFQFVPLLLLDNAVKYSYRDRVVYVDILEGPFSVKVRIISFGKIVPPDYRKKIFDKYERGPNVSSVKGMGLGLYFARKICMVHGTDIHYSCSTNDGQYGKNDFHFELPIAR